MKIKIITIKSFNFFLILFNFLPLISSFKKIKNNFNEVKYENSLMILLFV
jgi:hypothetical protein